MSHARAPNLHACDAIVEAVQISVQSNRPLLSQATNASTINTVALSHKENALHLGESRQFAIIEGILAKAIKKGHSEEGDLLFGALFSAVHGIIVGNPSANQEAISSSKTLLKSVIKVLYSDLEYANVSMHACLLISALVESNKVAQNRLSVVCDFIVDVLTTHPRDQAVIVNALKAISSLCHENEFTRMKLSATNICEELVAIMTNHLGDSSADQKVQYWCVRCIGDLAANEYQNQKKFSEGSCCNILMTLMRKQALEFSSDVSTLDSRDMLNWLLWAAGNLVQKPPVVVSFPNGDKLTSSLPQPNYGKFKEFGIIDVVFGLLVALPARLEGGYDGCSETFVWTVRLVLNLSRSKALRSEFNAKDVKTALNATFERVMPYGVSADVPDAAVDASPEGGEAKALVEGYKMQREAKVFLDQAIKLLDSGTASAASAASAASGSSFDSSSPSNLSDKATSTP